MTDQSDADEYGPDKPSAHIVGLQNLIGGLARCPSLAQAIRCELMPYGYWNLKDGREVAFNRRYAPLYEREPDKTWQPVAGKPYYAEIGATEFFYKDGHTEVEKRQRSVAGMARLGLLPATE